MSIAEKVVETAIDMQTKRGGKGHPPDMLFITESELKSIVEACTPAEMKVLSVVWDENEDDTKIRFGNRFIKADWIVRADVLNDAIALLQWQYNELMTCPMNARDDFKFNKVLSEVDL